jgi:hypothetical protein
MQTERFGFLGGEDEGHLRGALACFAAHRDLRPTVGELLWPATLLGHGFRGTAVWASEALLPRDVPQPAVLWVREGRLLSHASSLSYPDT